MKLVEDNMKLMEDMDGEIKFEAPGFIEKLKSGSYNKKIFFYSCLLACGGLVYEFIQNRMLSSRVNELQGKVDNLYQKINENKKDNEVLNKK